ncbi:MAG: HipA N-terminal domain-containing protein [Actinomycetota bacterium]
MHKGDRIVGRLVRGLNNVEFRYDSDYLASDGPGVATMLPRRSEPYRTAAGALPPFFTGLLPEGTRLQAVVTAVKTSVDDELSLLLAVGSDTVGDVRIVPTGETPRSSTPDLVTDPNRVRFADLLQRAVDPDAEFLDRRSSSSTQTASRSSHATRTSSSPSPGGRGSPSPIMSWSPTPAGNRACSSLVSTAPPVPTIQRSGSHRKTDASSSVGIRPTSIEFRSTTSHRSSSRRLRLLGRRSSTWSCSSPSAG